MYSAEELGIRNDRSYDDVVRNHLRERVGMSRACQDPTAHTGGSDLKELR
jgi:hypothetical protein